MSPTAAPRPQPDRRRRGRPAPAPPHRRARSPRRRRRSTTFVGLLAVITALNLLGLVMVLSASSVSALDDVRVVLVRRHCARRCGSCVGTVGLRRRRCASTTTAGGGWRCPRLVVTVVPARAGARARASASTSTARPAGSATGPLPLQPSELAKLTVLSSSPTCSPAGRPGWTTPRLTLRARSPSCSAASPLLLMLQPNLGTTLVLGAIVAAPCSTSPARRSCPLAGVAARRRRRRHRRWPCGAATGGPACSPSSTRGPTPQNTGYQNIQSLVGIAVGRHHRRRASAPAGPSGASCPTPTPTSSSPSSARSSASSARSSSSRLFVALVRARRPGRACARPTASACSLAAGITAWFVRAGVRQHRRRDRHPARSPACRCPFVSLRRLVAAVQHGRRRAAPERGPPGAGPDAPRRRAAREPRPATPADLRHRHRRRHRRPRPARPRHRRGAGGARATPRARSTTSAASGGSRPGWCPPPASR